jgi:hypothetical protein
VRTKRRKAAATHALITKVKVLVQFEDTPKAFAKFSPPLELATTLGHRREKN